MPHFLKLLQGWEALPAILPLPPLFAWKDLPNSPLTLLLSMLLPHLGMHVCQYPVEEKTLQAFCILPFSTSPLFAWRHHHTEKTTCTTEKRKRRQWDKIKITAGWLSLGRLTLFGGRPLGKKKNKLAGPQEGHLSPLFGNVPPDLITSLMNSLP